MLGNLFVPGREVHTFGHNSHNVEYAYVYQVLRTLNTLDVIPSISTTISVMRLDFYSEETNLGRLFQGDDVML